MIIPATMIPFVAREAPGMIAPRIGAGRTLKQKDLHLLLPLVDFPTICSAVLSQFLPTRPDLAKRRFPTVVALWQKNLVCQKKS